MEALIIAVGEGRRLYPFTKDNPKNFLSILGRSLFFYQLDLLKLLPINKVHVLFRLPIIEHFNKFKMECNFKIIPSVIEKSWQEVWNYTRNSVKSTLMIMNCDLVLATNWEKMYHYHKSQNADLTIAIYSEGDNSDGRKGKIRFVKSNNGYIIQHQKDYFPEARSINEIGLSIVEPRVLNLTNVLDYKEEDPWADEYIPMLIKKGYKVCYFESNEYWRDAGTWQRIQLIHNEFLINNYSITEASKDYLMSNYINFIQSSYIHKSVLFDQNTLKISNSFIDNNVCINKNVCIYNSIIMAGVRIKKNTILKNVIILPNTTINKDISNCVINKDNDMVALER